MTSLERHVVAVVEDHSLFADSLLLALEIDGYDMCRATLDDEYTPTSRLVAAILGFHPRTVLLDLELGPQGDGMRLIQPLALARVAVVVVTGSADRVRWGECLRNGACKVVGKGTSLREIRSLMRRLDHGLPVLAPAEREELFGLWRHHQAEMLDLHERFGRLTRRESEVLSLLMAGQQVSDIARARYVAESTVRTQVKAVLGKLQVSSQLAAVGLAHRAGWQATADAATSARVPAPRRPTDDAVRLNHQG